MTTGPFDAVLIDFYGTITAGDRDAVDAACRNVVESFSLPLGAAELAVHWGRRFFEVVDNSNHRAFRTLHECELESLRRTLDDLGVQANPAEYVVALEEYWANPPVHADALDFLRDLDLPVCCVSNADTAPITNAIEKHGLRFDAVITSEQSRCYKPDPKIFHDAAELLGVPPDRLIHIGDSLHSDIGGAAAAGVTSVWLCREGRIHDIGSATPDYEIHTLSQVWTSTPLRMGGAKK